MNEQRATRPAAGNLPIIASSFVGRHSELAEAKRQMEASRLLTLSGPGGVGKTRLAIQAGQLARRAFSDGVWLADLAAVHDSSRLADAIAAAVGVTDHSSRLAKEQLVGHLRDRRALIILDNCEHLADACAELVDCLLRQAPGLHVLATSRRPLGLPAERVLVVDPLPFPTGSALPRPDVLTQYESVALLVDRATAVQPHFAVTQDNLEAVARLCARLDGLPLAIELAATRLRSLSVEQVADRLDDRFELLTRGNPAAMSRQQTLRALIDWSYDLCTEQERTLWAALSVFPAEFDLPAVEGICAGTELGIDSADVLDLLDDLVSKSVVSARPASPSARYRLLETIRQYGRELLAARGLEPELRRRHRDHYLRLATRCCEQWCGPDQSANLTRLHLERDNLASALDWSLSEPSEPIAALRIVSALRYHWTLGGYLSTGRRRLDQVLRASAEPTPERGHALWVATWVALLQGETGAASTWLAETAELAEQFNDDHLRAYAELLSGTSALFADAPAEATQHFARGIALMRERGDTAATLWGLFQHSVALSHSGHTAMAQQACAEAIELAETRGETWARSEAMWARGFDRWRAGDANDTATALVREALTLTPNANHVSTVLGIELLAWIAASRSQHDEAARLMGAATSVWTSLGTTIDAFGPIFSRYSATCRVECAQALGETRLKALLDEGCANPTSVVGCIPAAVGAPDTPDHGPELTRREREVAALIAQGYTNKAIAGELVLSPRTVGGHVERLFAKIGVSNRAQVATWMSEHGERP